MTLACKNKITLASKCINYGIECQRCKAFEYFKRKE